MVGISCLMYFITVIPMLRWLLIFAYRPKFDGGGDKWPKLHHIIVSSLILGQVSLLEFLFFVLWNHLEISLSR